MPELAGYRGNSLELLSKNVVSIGDHLRLHVKDLNYEGILLPRYEHSDANYISIKLKNGYNIGIRVIGIQRIEKLDPWPEPKYAVFEREPITESLPRVSILGTGGTIACKIDYRTGGVYPAMTAEETYKAVPELSRIASIELESVMNIGSASLSPDHWTKLSERVADKIKDGVEGVVVAHGTDTMGYTAAALSFALQDTPIPIIMVGAQRSTDRPSSDAATNLVGAVTAAAKAPFAGVYVAMHLSMSDGSTVLLRGTKVRKNHTSRRDAFEPVNVPHAAIVNLENVEQRLKDLPPRRRDSRVTLKNSFEKSVGFLKMYPGFDPAIIEFLVEKGSRGIVIEGTGLGHAPSNTMDSIRAAMERDVIVCMTSQCIWGKTNLKVYNLGRDLLSLGVIPLGDILPETAVVKLMWTLGNASNMDEVRMLMVRPLAGEIANHSPLERRNQE